MFPSESNLGYFVGKDAVMMINCSAQLIDLRRSFDEFLLCCADESDPGGDGSQTWHPFELRASGETTSTVKKTTFYAVDDFLLSPVIFHDTVFKHHPIRGQKQSAVTAALFTAFLKVLNPASDSQTKQMLKQEICAVCESFMKPPPVWFRRLSPATTLRNIQRPLQEVDVQHAEGAAGSR